MKIVVTGGAGFIGSHIVDMLINDNHEVVILDSLEKQVHTKGKPNYLNPQAEYILGDIRDQALLKKALEGAEVLFHQASAVGVGQSMYEIGKYVDINSLGTAKVLDFLANNEHSLKKMIVASSMSIYGEGAYQCDNCGNVYPELRTDEQMKKGEWEMICPKCGLAAKPVPTNEDKPLRPTSIYAITKRDQEEMCLVVGKAIGVPTVALRYFNVYGPRQSLNNPYTGVCAIFSAKIKNGESPIIFEDGKQSRDFVFVEDIARANIMAMKTPNANFKSLNVGTGNPLTILQVAETLVELFGKDVKPDIKGEFRKGDIRHCYADITRIKQSLGFEPKTNLKEGMEKLFNWGETEKVIVDTDKAYSELKEKGFA